jgi:hypothetical protein
MSSINIYIQGPSAERFDPTYLAALSKLIAENFQSVSGLGLNKQRWFMFNTWEEIQQSQENTYILKGDIIGADSVAYDAEIVWQDDGRMPTVAYFSQIPVKSLQKGYGKLEPKVIPVGRCEFPMEWIPFWDSHLPDFFLRIEFIEPPEPAVIERVRRTVLSLDPAYEGLGFDGSNLSLSIDFGASVPIEKNIVELIGVIKELHRECPVAKVRIGVELEERD